MKYSTLLFLMIFFSSCSKSDVSVTEIEGIIMDYYSGRPISNMDVLLKNMRITPSSPEIISYNPFDTIKIVDKIRCIIPTGQFSKRIEGLKDGPYKLILRNDTMISVDAYDVTIGSQNVIEVLVKKLVNMKLIVNNKRKYYDKVYINIYDDHKIEKGLIIDGSISDTILNISVIPDTECAINLDYVKINSSIVTKDSLITITKDSSREYLIEY